MIIFDMSVYLVVRVSSRFGMKIYISGGLSGTPITDYLCI